MQEVLRLSLLTGEEELAQSVERDIQRSHSSADTLRSGQISQQALEAVGQLARAASSRELATPCLCLHAMFPKWGPSAGVFQSNVVGARLGNTAKAGTIPNSGACWRYCTIQHWRHSTTCSGLPVVCSLPVGASSSDSKLLAGTSCLSWPDRRAKGGQHGPATAFPDDV